MSHYDYKFSQRIVETDPPFAAIIMAALRKADRENFDNFDKLEEAFPEITRELRQRYHSPGGLLPGETPAI